MRCLKFCKDGFPFMCIRYKDIISVQRTSSKGMEIILAGAPTVTVVDYPSKEEADMAFVDICNHMGQEDWI